VHQLRGRLPVVRHQAVLPGDEPGVQRQHHHLLRALRRLVRELDGLLRRIRLPLQQDLRLNVVTRLQGRVISSIDERAGVVLPRALRRVPGQLDADGRAARSRRASRSRRDARSRRCACWTAVRQGRGLLEPVVRRWKVCLQGQWTLHWREPGGRVLQRSVRHGRTLLHRVHQERRSLPSDREVLQRHLRGERPL
jgi:hypothetical protein